MEKKHMMTIDTYRGYIRNWRTLCSELDIGMEDRNAREREILVRGYEKWGESIYEHLNGSFAFVLRDTETGALYGLRDPFGTRSFYYYRAEDGRLLCGTSIQEVLDQGGVRKELNEDMLQLYLSLTYTAGEDTFYRGLKKLMPGHYLTWTGEKLTITKYWTPQFNPDEEKSLEEWADEIHHTVEECVSDNIEEGEYAESFLSGGVDSSYMAAMSRHVTVTNSASFEDPQFDESGLAAQTAACLGKESRRCVIGPDEYFKAVPRVIRWLEQPLGDASTIALAISCESVKKHTDICYSGEGVDEFYGGYRAYKNAEKYGETVRTHYVGNTNIMKEEEKKNLLKRYNPSVLPIMLTDAVYKDLKTQDPLSWMMAVDISIWLEGDIYFAIDKLGLGTGLEVRMPLTDLRMFDIASRLPSRYKVTQDADKIAFRHAAAKALPDEVAFRTKMGFPVPIRKWLASEQFLKDIRTRFESEDAALYFHPEKLQALLDAFTGGEEALWRKIWTIYVFLVWYDECFKA